MRLEELIDLSILQKLQENLNDIYSFPTAIIDNESNVLTAVGWYDVCNKFHRQNPACEKACRKSDQYIIDHAHITDKPITYKCVHGLVDCAMPIIVNGAHLANFFTGQFFLDPPDVDFFKKQALKYNFDQDEYLEAVRKVPIWSREELDKHNDYIKGFVKVISTLAESNIKGNQLKLDLSDQVEISHQLELEKTISKKNEERYLTLLNNLSAGIVVHGKDSRIIINNSVASELLGLSNDQLKGMEAIDSNWYFFNRKGQVMSAEEYPVNLILKSGKPLKNYIAGINQPKSNKKVWVSVDGYPAYNSSGEIDEVLISFIDITALITSHEDLVSSKAETEKLNKLLASITDNMLDMVAIVDFSGVYSYISNSYKTLGYVPESLRGRNAFDLIHPDDLDSLLNQFNQSLNKKTETKAEYRFRMANGKYTWLETIGKVITDNQFIIGSRDISERKNNLKELLEAKQKAEESDRLKSAFLSNMSHEIRTPMNGILGFSSLLSDPETTHDDRVKYVQIIEQNGDRLLSLLNNLIDYSKLEAGQMIVQKTDVDIHEVMNNLKILFLEKLNKKGLSIEFELDNAPPKINTDRYFLEAILINLISNAIKYSDSGIIFINIGRANNQLTCAVKDKGIGIPKDKLDFIFERFVQENVSLTRKYEGAGLGLAISKSYIELLGGKIWVDSVVGEGSSFSFSIPIEG